MNLDWVGGFADGEGCFTAQIDAYGRRRGHHKGRGFQIRPMIHITQCNLTILRTIRRFVRCGAVHSQGTRITEGLHFRHVYALRVTGWRDCRKFLDLIEPHLILKRKHAKLMRKMLRLRGTPGREHRMSLEQLLGILDVAMQLRLLNYRDPTEALERLQTAKNWVLSTMVRP